MADAAASSGSRRARRTERAARRARRRRASGEALAATHEPAAAPAASSSEIRRRGDGRAPAAIVGHRVPARLPAAGEPAGAGERLALPAARRGPPTSGRSCSVAERFDRRAGRDGDVRSPRRPPLRSRTPRLHRRRRAAGARSTRSPASRTAGQLEETLAVWRSRAPDRFGDEICLVLSRPRPLQAGQRPASAIRPATRCCARSARRARGRRCARATSPGAGAGRSSSLILAGHRSLGRRSAARRARRRARSPRQSP